MLIVCIAGYIWISFNLHAEEKHSNVTTCIIKRCTNIPCPSCGTTRSIILLTHADFFNALILNPLGFFAAIFLIVVPLWILIDLLFKKDSLYAFYKSFELFLQKPKYAILFIFLIVLNWIWNIYKGL